MPEDCPPSPRRISRRTRGERTKRRERYLLSSGKNNSPLENNEISHDVSASSGDSAIYSVENNNWDKCHRVVMGNKIVVDMLL